VAGNTPGQGNLPEDCHPKVRQLVCYWLKLRSGPYLPARRQLDPTAFFPLLPDIRLVDVVGAPPRYRVRLTGERIRHHLGNLHTGLFLDDVFASFTERASGIAFARAVRTKQLHWDGGACDLAVAVEEDVDAIPMERVVLPLADDGVTVDALLILALLGSALDHPLPRRR